MPTCSRSTLRIQPIKRLNQSLHVQRRRGDLALASPSLVHRPTAPKITTMTSWLCRTRSRSREQQVAQRHGVALGLARRPRCPRRRARSDSAAAQRLDRTRPSTVSVNVELISE
jgi:hypothetical protein